MRRVQGIVLACAAFAGSLTGFLIARPGGSGREPLGTQAKPSVVRSGTINDPVANDRALKQAEDGRSMESSSRTQVEMRLAAYRSVLNVFSEESQRAAYQRCIELACKHSLAAQEQVLASLGALPPDQALERAKRYLGRIVSVELLAKLEAIASSNPQAYVAYVLAANWDKPVSSRALRQFSSTQDQRIIEALFAGLDVGFPEFAESSKANLEPVLIPLILRAESPYSRERSLVLLQGSSTPEAIRFFMDRLANDANERVQLKALESLPVNWRVDSLLPAEQLQVMWQVIRRVESGEGVKQGVAKALLALHKSGRQLLSDEDVSLLQKLAGPPLRACK